MAIGKKKMRAPAYTAGDANVVDWAVSSGILSQKVGNSIKSANSWSVRVNPSAKKATSYFSKVSNGVYNKKGRNEVIPGHIEAFMARVGIPLHSSDASKVSDKQREVVARNLGMDKPENILNVNTEGEKPMKPSSNIEVLRQALNDGVSAGADQTSDGQLDGARQRQAIKEINKRVEKSTSDITGAHETKQENERPKTTKTTPEKEKPDEEPSPTQPATETADQPTPTPTQPTTTPEDQPTQPPTTEGGCPPGTVPVTQTETTPDIPGVAEKPAADPNSTDVQPGTLGFIQEPGPRRRLTTVEDIAQNAKQGLSQQDDTDNDKAGAKNPIPGHGQVVQNHEPYETDLRPEYAMEKAANVIPSTRKQLESDIRFDMFDHVKPGFGEGMDNRLFLMSEARDKKIVYAPGLHEPGQWIGPTAGVDVPPWQWQRVIPGEQLQKYHQEQQARMYAGDQLLLGNNGPRSSNILGDDIGYPMPYSACELKRNRYSPFEPIIRTDMHWQQVKEPTGVKLNRKRMRLETDAQRYPRALDSYVAGQGGAHLPKRRALEVVLP
jgi:hypothetical protein